MFRCFVISVDGCVGGGNGIDSLLKVSTPLLLQRMRLQVRARESLDGCHLRSHFGSRAISARTGVTAVSDRATRACRVPLFKMVVSSMALLCLLFFLSLRSSVAASFGCDNGVMLLQASGWCFWELPSILVSPYVDALTYKFGSFYAAILDVFNAAIKWACPQSVLPSDGFCHCEVCPQLVCGRCRCCEAGCDAQCRDGWVCPQLVLPSDGFCHGEVCPRLLDSRVDRCVRWRCDRHLVLLSV